MEYRHKIHKNNKNLTSFNKNSEKIKRIEMKGSLTLPSMVLQMLLLQDKKPPKDLIEAALKSLHDIAQQLAIDK